MFIAALFTIAKTRKQPKCPSTDEWIKKLWYTCTHTHTHKVFKSHFLPQNSKHSQIYKSSTMWKVYK